MSFIERNLFKSGIRLTYTAINFFRGPLEFKEVNLGEDGYYPNLVNEGWKLGFAGVNVAMYYRPRFRVGGSQSQSGTK